MILLWALVSTVCGAAQQLASNESVTFGSMQLVTVGTNLKGFSAIVPNFNWRYNNVTELYVGSAYGKALYRFGNSVRACCGSR
jgi:hypothetical protein